MTDAELVQFVLDEAADLFEVIRELKRHAYTPELRSQRLREYERTPNRRTHANERRYRLNERLREEATRHYSEWTGPELELAGREDLTARQVAEMTGRTLKAVKTIRTKLRREPRLQNLRGVSS